MVGDEDRDIVPELIAILLSGCDDGVAFDTFLQNDDGGANAFT